MEFFPDREHVRLRSREEGTYLHADEDGWGVSLSPHRASLNTAWAVHLLPEPHTGATHVLLHSAAYGGYLGLRPDWPQPQGHVVVLRMVQCLFNTAPMQPDITWEVLTAEDGNGGVVLSHLDRRVLNNSTWTVEPIPPRPAPPQLPGHIPNGAFPPVALSRQIRYIREDDAGIFILPSRGELQFNGRSLHYLRGDLAYQLDDAIDNVTLCVRGGSFGRVTPLVVDLPLSEEPMEIVVLTTGSAAAMALRHPNVDAP